MSIELQSPISSLPRTSLSSADRMPDTVDIPLRGANRNEQARANAELPGQFDPPINREVDQVAKQAAELMFKGREIEVRGIHDDGSGRFIYRISDKSSGQILAQTPPDALLRFFASYEGVSKPLVSVDA